MARVILSLKSQTSIIIQSQSKTSTFRGRDRQQVSGSSLCKEHLGNYHRGLKQSPDVELGCLTTEKRGKETQKSRTFLPTLDQGTIIRTSLSEHHYQDYRAGASKHPFLMHTMSHLLYPSPSEAALRNLYVGKRLNEVNAPAALVDRAIVKRNCSQMLNACRSLRVEFRAHVKTHKVQGAPFHCLPITVYELWVHQTMTSLSNYRQFRFMYLASCYNQFSRILALSDLFYRLLG